MDTTLLNNNTTSHKETVMKFCEVCCVEIGTKDGENRCAACEEETQTKNRRVKARRQRKAREQAMKDCGLVKVRGALGGTYWE
jgi:hypothetical protein